MQFRIKRTELYTRVWQTPMYILCRELGVSDRGLAKICKRAGVPVPPPGHWRRLELGLPSPQTPLGDSDNFDEIVIAKSSTPEFPNRKSIPKIDVSDFQSDPHQLITAAKKALRPSKYSNFLTSDGEGCLDIRVSTGTLQRALLIMNAVVKALEARGAKVSANTERNTGAEIEHEWISFYIYESQRMVKNEEAQRNRQLSSGWFLDVGEPSGRLALVINGYCDSLRRSFQDGRRQRVEDVVGEFVETIFMFAAGYKRRTEKRIQEAKAQRAREELVALEKKRIAALDHSLAAMERAALVRHYATLAQTRCTLSEPQRTEWLEWVHRYAQRLENEIWRPRLETERHWEW